MSGDMTFKNDSEFGSYRPLTFSEAVVEMEQDGGEPVFKKVKKLGQGKFGIVYLMTHIPSGTKCAVKIILENNAKYGYAWDLDSKRLFFREIETQLALAKGVPEFSTFIGFSLPSTQDQKASDFCRYPVLINLFMENGSLEGKIATLTSTQRSKIILGVAVQMAYVHKIGVIHRDLKPENVLLDENFEPHISDFGTAKLMASNEMASHTSSIGTVVYIAPEVMDKEVYNQSADVWSFGILAHQILTGKDPWPVMDTKVIGASLMAKQGPPIDGSLGDDLQGLVQACLFPDPEERGTFQEIAHVMMEKYIVADGTDIGEYDEYRDRMRAAYHSLFEE